MPAGKTNEETCSGVSKGSMVAARRQSGAGALRGSSYLRASIEQRHHGEALEGAPSIRGGCILRVVGCSGAAPTQDTAAAAVLAGRELRGNCAASCRWDAQSHTDIGTAVQSCTDHRAAVAIIAVSVSGARRERYAVTLGTAMAGASPRRRARRHQGQVGVPPGRNPYRRVEHKHTCVSRAALGSGPVSGTPHASPPPASGT